MYFSLRDAQNSFKKQVRNIIRNANELSYLTKHLPKVEVDLINDYIIISGRFDTLMYQLLENDGLLDIIDNANMHNNNIKFFETEVTGFDNVIKNAYNRCLLGTIVDKYNMSVNTCITKEDITLLNYREYLFNNMSDENKKEIDNDINKIKFQYSLEGILIIKYKILEYDKSRFIRDCQHDLLKQYTDI